MAAFNRKENSTENDAVIQLKLETAAIVENIVRNLDAKISTSRDFKILSDSILQREAMIRHLQYILANQSVSSKPKLVNQEQQTFPPDDDPIDTSLKQKDNITQTFKIIDVTAFTQTNPENPQPVQNISIQTDEDQVVLSNLTKISKLERDLSKMDHNQNLLLSELKVQKEDCLALQTKISLMKKKLADVTFANNLYHVSLVEQSCSLPADAEELLSSLSKGGKADDLHSSFIIKSFKEQDAINPFIKVQVDTLTIKQEEPTNQLPEDHSIATLFPLKKDSTHPPKKDATKTLTKEMAWINMMSKVLSKLEKKFAIPLDKRKPRMFKRKIKTNHIIPKPFKTMFHLLAAPEPDPIFVPEPYPKLGWSAVRFKPALPSPEACPMYGVSQDSEVYSMKNSG